jgi:hypothetical protein
MSNLLTPQLGFLADLPERTSEIPAFQFSLGGFLSKAGKRQHSDRRALMGALLHPHAVLGGGTGQ